MMSFPSATPSVHSLLESTSREPDNILSLLGKYRVIVPGIQRHYVQGDETSKAREVRTTFVRDIFAHIRSDKPLCLDFIYGPIDTAGPDAFIPTDGQQRLTTVWLLTRYFADRLDEPARFASLKLLSRFTYEDRIHATRFCEAFTSPDARFRGQDDISPSFAITRSGWFNSYWSTDSTVAGMLNTLDTIAETRNRLAYQELTDDRCLEYIYGQLTFQLCVKQFADDIYMKMNARGLTLTQWENFKGRFAEQVKNAETGSGAATGLDWDARIERLSDAYYARANNKLPDKAFLALMARILVYEAYKVAEAKDILSCAANVVELARHSAWTKDLPYVPFEEFTWLVSKTSICDVAGAFLLMLGYVTDPEHAASIPKSPYWQTDRTLIQSLCQPEDENERDLSLCVYEYFKKFSNPGRDNFALALRLMWNILENVTRGDPKQQRQYNRVEGICQIIASRQEALYHKGMTVDNAAPQYTEEAAKAALYADATLRKDDIVLMQAAEEYMHGRVRLGLLDLRESGGAAFSVERLKALNALFEKYNDPKMDQSCRRHIVLMVVAGSPCEDAASVTLGSGNNDLRRLLTTSNDKSQQVALLDFLAEHQYQVEEISHKELLENNPYKFSSRAWWQRDWRETLLKIWSKEKGYEAFLEMIWGRTLRRHRSGGYYLYRNETIRDALPINDYRIELLLPENRPLYNKEGLGRNFMAVTMNDAETRSGKYEPLGCGEACSVVSRYLYFYSNCVEVRDWSENKHVNRTNIGENKNAAYSVAELLTELSDALIHAV